MTTGMKREETTVARRERRINWTWAIIALIVAIALVSIAVYSAKHTGANTAGYPATTGSVQNSGTGSQGSVGKFTEPVVPNQPKQGTVGTNAGTQTPGTTVTHSNVPLGAPSQKLGPNGVSVNQNAGKGVQSNNYGQHAGAGNTGINTATDSVGGAYTKQMQGQGTLPGYAGNRGGAAGGGVGANGSSL